MLAVLRKQNAYNGNHYVHITMDNCTIFSFDTQDLLRATKVFKSLVTDADYMEYYIKYVQIPYRS